MMILKISFPWSLLTPSLLQVWKLSYANPLFRCWYLWSISYSDFIWTAICVYYKSFASIDYIFSTVICHCYTEIYLSFSFYPFILASVNLLLCIMSLLTFASFIKHYFLSFSILKAFAEQFIFWSFIKKIVEGVQNFFIIFAYHLSSFYIWFYFWWWFYEIWKTRVMTVPVQVTIQNNLRGLLQY